MNHIDAYAEARQLGQTFPELRCTFAGRSIIPDIVFLLDEHIETDERDEILDPTVRPPDIHVEIVSPNQSVRKCREKLVFSTANGCPLGWLIDPGSKNGVCLPARSPCRAAAGRWHARGRARPARVSSADRGAFRLVEAVDRADIRSRPSTPGEPSR